MIETLRTRRIVKLALGGIPIFLLLVAIPSAAASLGSSTGYVYGPAATVCGSITLTFTSDLYHTTGGPHGEGWYSANWQASWNWYGICASNNGVGELIDQSTSGSASGTITCSGPGGPSYAVCSISYTTNPVIYTVIDPFSPIGTTIFQLQMSLYLSVTV
jgi:hypothetical protein